jgi:putative colanic acid biosynthesis UDP-glucose lipid carrier transferase
LYNESIIDGLLGSIVKIFFAWGAAVSMLFVYFFFTKTSEDYSRLWLGYWITASFLTLMTSRVIIFFMLRWHYSHPANLSRVILYGDAASAEKVYSDSKILNSRGFNIIGVITSAGVKPERLKQIVVGSHQNIADVTSALEADEVWNCCRMSEETTTEKLLYDLRNTTVNIRQIISEQDRPMFSRQISHFGYTSTLDISCSPHTGGHRFAKIAEDYLLGSIIFLAIIPLLCTIAIAIKATSKGPVLFKQYRQGIDGRKFKVYKFRSMSVHQSDPNNLVQATRNDTRVTKLGRILRKTSLDELPQFFNVLQGRMSLVGPRPHAMEHNDYYGELIDSYMRRHMVKPGITGWAQINGYRGETETVDKMKARVDFDLYYIENWSLGLDLKILLLTPIRLLQSLKDTY